MILPAVFVAILSVFRFLLIYPFDYLFFQPGALINPLTGVLFIPLIVSFSYILSRPYSIENYLKQGLEQAVIEFETIKKTLTLVLLLTLFIGVLVFAIPLNSIPEKDLNYYLFVNDFAFAVSMQFMLLGIGGLSMYMLIITRKKFRYYFARTCFMSVLNKEDAFRQMYYFNLGLRAYNKYLKRHLKYQIKDSDRIFSNVGLLQNDKRINEIGLLCNRYNTENDTLEPLRFISSELLESKDIEPILIPVSLKSQLKTVAAF